LRWEEKYYIPLHSIPEILVVLATHFIHGGLVFSSRFYIFYFVFFLKVGMAGSACARIRMTAHQAQWHGDTSTGHLLLLLLLLLLISYEMLGLIPSLTPTFSFPKKPCLRGGSYLYSSRTLPRGKNQIIFIIILSKS